MQRVVAEHEPEVLRREEEPGEHPGRPEEADAVGDRDVALAEEPQGHERGRNA